MKETSCNEKSEFKLVLLEIPKPCSVPWESMKGSSRIRFCDQCQKNVFNISDMTESEAVNLIVSREGKVCISMLKRADGTIVSDECPPILRPLRDGYKKLAAAFSALMALSLASAPVNSEESKSKPAQEQNSNQVPPMRTGGAVAYPPENNKLPKQEQNEKSEQKKAVETADQLKKLAKITESQAKAAARKAVPGGIIQNVKLLRDSNDAVVYILVMNAKGFKKEVRVDASTAAILGVKLLIY
ncbi:MAG: PepSY domain-containing protein [Candidatus Obscuribacterales bacterium]|nr:PepSY domain-containing protein [Candidatus Obscuribacterales bacterium]